MDQIKIKSTQKFNAKNEIKVISEINLKDYKSNFAFKIITYSWTNRVEYTYIYIYILSIFKN